MNFTAICILILPSYTANSNKLRKQYTWKEKTKLEKGIIETIDWIKEDIDYFVKVSLDYLHKK